MKPFIRIALNRIRGELEGSPWTVDSVEQGKHFKVTLTRPDGLAATVVVAVSPHNVYRSERNLIRDLRKAVRDAESRTVDNIPNAGVPSATFNRR